MSQEQNETQKINPIRPTSPDAIRLAKTLVRTANFGALATLDPVTGFPLASRVAVATDSAGAPVILISDLSAHSKALAADRRCSLLLGEPGKGDPVAHPRITILCEAQRLKRDEAETVLIKQRYLRRQPKANLYADFGDFAFVRLRPVGANLNAGFGKAFVLDAEALMAPSFEPTQTNQDEAMILSTINHDNAPLLASIGKREFPAERSLWQAVGVDAEGIDLVTGTASIRVWRDDLDPKKVALIKQIQWLSSR